MTWIPEQDAAKMINRHPRYLRGKVKSGAWPVKYSAIEGRKFHYSKADIEKLINSYSNVVKGFS